MKMKTKIKKQNQKQKFNTWFFILPRHLHLLRKNVQMIT